MRPLQVVRNLVRIEQELEPQHRFGGQRHWLRLERIVHANPCQNSFNQNKNYRMAKGDQLAGCPIDESIA